MYAISIVFLTFVLVKWRFNCEICYKILYLCPFPRVPFFVFDSLVSFLFDDRKWDGGRGLLLCVEGGCLNSEIGDCDISAETEVDPSAS
ncbi:hypothetical protein VNO80_08103 [Phaseolus coccineus]|uniref:Secreted protein n=1 Tax=Phaseolus coccineus TaxID=3886 RepID=A0AAN9NKY4_PHACN